MGLAAFADAGCVFPAFYAFAACFDTIQLDFWMCEIGIKNAYGITATADTSHDRIRLTILAYALAQMFRHLR